MRKNSIRKEKEKKVKDKSLKIILKKLRVVLSNNYAIIYNLALDSRLTLEDIEDYIQVYPNINTVLEQRRLREKEEIQKKNFETLVNLKRPSAEKFLQQLQDERIMITEALRQALTVQCTTPQSIQHNTNEIRRLQSKINEIDKTIAALQQAMHTEKRGPGRPKKSETIAGPEVEDEKD